MDLRLLTESISYVFKVGQFGAVHDARAGTCIANSSSRPPNELLPPVRLLIESWYTKSSKFSTAIGNLPEWLMG